MPALIDSPQANVPDYVPLVPVSLDGQFGTTPLRPQPPVVLGGSTTLDAYNVITQPTKPRARVVFVQNNSAQVLYYAYDTDASATVYHGIIAAATQANNGTGGKVMFEVAKYGISRVSLFSASGNINAAVESFISL